MVRYYKLGKIYEKFKLATVSYAWIDNDIRKGCLIGLNKCIEITIPISSSTLTNQVTSKLVNTSLHNHGLIPKYLNNKFNDCDNSINKIKIGEVGYKLEKYFENDDMFEGCVMEILKGTKSNINRNCWYSANDDLDDLVIVNFESLKG